jgi:hypothetical protein
MIVSAQLALASAKNNGSTAMLHVLILIRLLRPTVAAC